MGRGKDTNDVADRITVGPSTLANKYPVALSWSMTAGDDTPKEGVSSPQEETGTIYE